MSVSEELAKLAALRDQGVLTEEEFAARKQALLAGPVDGASVPAKSKGRASKGCAVLLLIVVVLAVLGSIIGGGAKKDGGADAKKDGATAVEAKPAVEVTAEQLFQAYQANEAAAQQAYGDSQLLVSGTVAGVDLDLTNDPIVKLRTSNQFMSAQAKLVDADKAGAARLTKGSRITLRCESVSEVIGTPILSDCAIQ